MDIGYLQQILLLFRQSHSLQSKYYTYYWATILAEIIKS